MRTTSTGSERRRRRGRMHRLTRCMLPGWSSYCGARASVLRAAGQRPSHSTAGGMTSLRPSVVRRKPPLVAPPFINAASSAPLPAPARGRRGAQHITLSRALSRQHHICRPPLADASKLTELRGREPRLLVGALEALLLGPKELRELEALLPPE